MPVVPVSACHVSDTRTCARKIVVGSRHLCWQGACGFWSTVHVFVGILPGEVFIQRDFYGSVGIAPLAKLTWPCLFFEIQWYMLRKCLLAIDVSLTSSLVAHVASSARCQMMRDIRPNTHLTIQRLWLVKLLQ